MRRDEGYMQAPTWSKNPPALCSSRSTLGSLGELPKCWSLGPPSHPLSQLWEEPLVLKTSQAILRGQARGGPRTEYSFWRSSFRFSVLNPLTPAGTRGITAPRGRLVAGREARLRGPVNGYYWQATDFPPALLQPHVRFNTPCVLPSSSPVIYYVLLRCAWEVTEESPPQGLLGPPASLRLTLTATPQGRTPFLCLIFDVSCLLDVVATAGVYVTGCQWENVASGGSCCPVNSSLSLPVPWPEEIAV